ncbi:MAG: hypothetical protein U1E62_21900 [Alsobacter sp.]
MSKSDRVHYSCLLSLALAIAVASPGRSRADVLEPMQKAGEFSIYIGVMPSQIVGGHPAGHPEATMHGGAPSGGRSKHLVAAVFDPAGHRVEDLSVNAIISEPGHVDVQRVRLEPMQIANTITYGAFITVSDRERETIVIELSKGVELKPISATFTYVP